jgi:tight adherence protein B
MSIITLFFIVMLVAFATMFYVTEPSKDDKRINARLVALNRSELFNEEDENSIVRQVTFSRIAAIDRFLRRNRFALYLQRLLVQANVTWTVGRVVFTTLLCIGFGALLGNWWIASGLLGWLSGLALGSLPILVLLKKRARRFRLFTALLPQAVDLMSRCLRSGQALPSAIEVVAVEIPAPLGTEFQYASDEQNYGLPFRESMLNLVMRIPVPDLQFLVTAMLLQKETGGNLVEILEKTSQLLRERQKVNGQLKVRTAQGRFTGWILCLLPFAIFIGMNLISPGYGQILFDDPSGQRWVEIAAALMVVGIFLIRRLVNVKV